MYRFMLIILGMWLCLCPSHARAQIAAQITNVSDMNLPSWGIGDPAVSAHMDVCVYSLGGLLSTSYAVTVSSPGGFNLASGANKIPYQLYWDSSGSGALGSTSGTQITNGTKLASQMNANILSPLCALGLAGPTARLNLKIAQTDMTAALAGTYTGTITILISPN